MRLPTEKEVLAGPKEANRIKRKKKKGKPSATSAHVHVQQKNKEQGTRASQRVNKIKEKEERSRLVRT